MADDWETMADDLDAFTLGGDENKEEPKATWEDEVEGDWESTSAWDTSKDSVPPPQPKNQEKSGVVAPKVLTKAQKKKQTLELLQRKKEEEQRRAQISAEEIRKQREEEISRVKESDMQNALDLFGGVGDQPVVEAPVVKKVPKTTAQFVEFASGLANEAKQYSSSPEYLNCVKEITRQICDVDNLSVEDVRAVVQTLNTLINTKLKEEKGGKKKGKAKAGAKINVSRGAGGDFDDHKAGEFDDYLDFM
eukprot:TRINITY_DN14790_c0_g1_i1.p1 TRINITY_DN14790_c0_g1~~TRINITY_DN14790_c0_g1_i1.p1  ORF type:complete len:249 (-),score=105.78 TRINITY_DN14790_c0_g1_i1:48-794(-)